MTLASKPAFVLGVDLDGVVADFYSYMRTVAAEWLGRDIEELTADVTWGFPQWGLQPGEYTRLHRFALTQRDLFRDMPPIVGAPQALRRLSRERVRIRVITHRLAVLHEHETAILQTVRWLEYHDVPYWDLCFMEEKGDVGAALYVEDGPHNIQALRDAGRDVIVFANSTNRHVADGRVGRAGDWQTAELMIRDHYYEWLDAEGRPRPPSPGQPPPDEVES